MLINVNNSTIISSSLSKYVNYSSAFLNNPSITEKHQKLSCYYLKSQKLNVVFLRKEIITTFHKNNKIKVYMIKVTNSTLYHIHILIFISSWFLSSSTAVSPSPNPPSLSPTFPDQQPACASLELSHPSPRCCNLFWFPSVSEVALLSLPPPLRCNLRLLIETIIMCTSIKKNCFFLCFTVTLRSNLCLLI